MKKYLRKSTLNGYIVADCVRRKIEMMKTGVQPGTEQNYEVEKLWRRNY
jgi:hypothetical protein